MTILIILAILFLALFGYIIIIGIKEDHNK